MNEGPTIEAGYIEELRSALEKAKIGWLVEDVARAKELLWNSADQLLSDARLGQLIREGGDAVVAVLARFAKAADRIERYDGEHYDAPLYAMRPGGALRELLDGEEGDPLTVADLRRARAALSALREMVR